METTNDGAVDYKTTTQQQVQARFYTQQPRYSIKDIPYNISSSVTGKELNDLISRVLGLAKDVVKFDFFINGQILRVPLWEEIETSKLNTEEVLPIEYIVKQSAPLPRDSIEHDDWLSSIHSNTNGQVITGCYDGSCYLRSIKKDCLLLAKISGHSEPVNSVKFVIPDSQEDYVDFLSASQDQTISLWRVDQTDYQSSCLVRFKGHSESVDCLAVDPECTNLASGSWDNLLKIWSLRSQDDEIPETSSRRKKPRTGAPPVPVRTPLVTLSGHSGPLSGLAWGPDAGLIYTASWDHTIKVFDLNKSLCSRSFLSNKVFLAVDYSSRNRLLAAGSADKFIRLYDTRVEEPSTLAHPSLTGHVNWVSGVSWSPREEFQLLSGSYDGLVKLWDIRSPRAALYDLSGHTERVFAVHWAAAEDASFSVGADSHLRVFSMSSRQ